MKNQLLNLKMIALVCLMMVLGGANVWAADKITDVANIVSGGKYYIGATTSNGADWYLKIAGSSIVSDKKGVATKSISEGAIFVIEKNGNSWNLKFDGTNNYLALNSDNAKLNVVSTATAFTFTNKKGLIYMTSKAGSTTRCLRRNSNATNSNFGSYSTSGSFLDVWLMPATPAKTLTSLAISGEPSKKTYEAGEALDPTGLVVTGTYDDNTTATITAGITWTMNPATLSLNDVSCSVTATVDGVTSPAYNVTGLTVNKAKLPATINLKGNATTLATDDEPNTFTVDYDGDGTLSATASTEGVVDLALVGNTVTVTPKAAGSVDITISATEGTEYKSTSTTYTVNVVPVGIRALRNSITSISQNKKDAFTAVKLRDAVVTYVGVKYGKKTFYVEDDKAGIVFYNIKNLNYEVGDVLNGTISGEGFIYQGLTEVTSINSNSNITVTKGGKVPCTEITLAELNENMDKWESRRVKVVNSILTTALDANNDNDAIISQDGSSIVVYEKIDDCSGGKLANEGFKLESVVGYPVDFLKNQDSEILNELCVWEKSDIVVAEPTYTAQTLTFIAKDGADYYATFSNDKVVFMPYDVTPMTVVVDATGKISEKELTSTTATIGTESVNGYYIPAKTGVLLRTDKTSVEYYTVDNYAVDALAADANMLMPAPVAGGVFDATADNMYYYKLAYGDWTNKTQLGFYWGAAEGGAFYVKAETAYLAVPKANAAGAKGFAFNGEATGIEGVNANVENVKAIYNLNGQRVASMAKPGLYIVNGKKVVRK